MQHKWRPSQGIERCLDRIEVFGTLSQNEHLAALIECIFHFSSYGLGPGQIVGEMPKHILDARISWQVDPRQA